jgi:hypothetical protein
VKILLAPILVLCLCQTSLCNQASIYFDNDSSSINLQGQNTLDSLASYVLLESFNNAIMLSGHTDSDASAEYNQALSLKRLHSVRKYLISKGLKTQFHLNSKGESQILEKEKSEAAKTRNRRVDINLNYSTDNQTSNLFKPEIQEFTISHKKDTILKCKNGTQIHIKKNSFKLRNKRRGVTIRVQEFYAKDSFVKNKLTTLTTDSQILESKGMIKIEAFQIDAKIELDKKKSIGILYRDRVINDSTMLFNGVHQNQNMVWKKDPNSVITQQLSYYSYSYSWNENDTINVGNTWHEKINNEWFEITHKHKTKGPPAEHNWFRDLIEATEPYEKDTVPADSKFKMRQLLMTSSSLGWINCDRFYNSKAPKIDLIVKCNEEYIPELSLVFSNINAVLPYSYREDNKFIFKNIPINMEFRLVALYCSARQSNIKFSFVKGNSNSKIVGPLVFQSKSEKQIENQLKILNKK